MTIGLLLLAGAAVSLLIGAELFAEHAASAGRRLGITALAVGVLLAGAEPEELITAITAAVRDRPGIAAGDAIGANVTMLTLSLGLAAVVRPLPLRGRVRTYTVGATLAGAAAFVVLLDGRVSRLEGVALVGLYIALVAVVWRREREPPQVGEVAEVLEESASDSPVIGLVLAVVGIAIMALGGTVAVEGAERVAEAMSATDTAVGLTLVALATTAELLALVWAAARRDISELAVAAVVGSAAYNATATLGGAALARPFLDVSVRGAAAAATLLPACVLVLGGRDRMLNRGAGLALVAGYAVFLAVALR